MPPAAEAAARSTSVGPRRTPAVRAARMSAAGAIAAPGIPRPRTRIAPRTRSAPRPQPSIAGSLLGAIWTLPQHRLVDRLMRGRLWIGLVAFSLIGIVAMQLAILDLNTGIGRSLAQASRLQRENPALSIENSTAAAGENVEPKATARGMEMASVARMQFLNSSPSDVRRAAQILREPAASTPAPATPSSTADSAPAETATSETSTGSATAPSQSENTSSAAPAEATAAGTTSESPTQTTTPSQTSSGQATTESTEASASPPVTTNAGAGGGTQAGTQE